GEQVTVNISKRRHDIFKKGNAALLFNRSHAVRVPDVNKYYPAGIFLYPLPEYIEELERSFHSCIVAYAGIHDLQGWLAWQAYCGKNVRKRGIHPQYSSEADIIGS